MHYFSKNNLITINAAAELTVMLTSSNYSTWRDQFNTLLFGLDLICFINVNSGLIVSGNDDIMTNFFYMQSSFFGK